MTFPDIEVDMFDEVSEMEVLIVDDQPPMRKILKDILRAAGFEDITTMENGVLAWEEIYERPYPFQFILLDWKMPKMSGLELLQKIRELEEYADVPILMVTAETESDQVIAAIESGVTSYVVKPFAPNTVFKKIKELFGNKISISG